MVYFIAFLEDGETRDIKTYLGVTIRICSIPRRHGTWYAELAWSIGVLKGKRTLLFPFLKLLGLLIYITVGWRKHPLAW